jgi:hypothetical protein
MAQGKANAVEATELTVSTSFLELIKSFNDAYNTLKNDLTITDNAELKKYIYAMELGLISNYQSVTVVSAN